MCARDDVRDDDMYRSRPRTQLPAAYAHGDELHDVWRLAARFVLYPHAWVRRCGCGCVCVCVGVCVCVCVCVCARARVCVIVLR
jgi:hypothetical protein